MKSIAVVAVVVVLSASRLLAETPAASEAAIPGAAPTKPSDITIVDPKAPPVAPAPVVVKKEEPKKPVKEKIYTIPGLTIPRPNGTFLGFQIADGKMKILFYDKKKKPMSADVTGGLARWANNRGPGDNRSPLNVDGNALISAKPALPPFNYNIYLTLLNGPEEARTTETYTVQYRG